MAESKNCINLQIKVYPEEKARFLKIKDEMDEIIKTDRETITQNNIPELLLEILP